jgi:hypothetical protein
MMLVRPALVVCGSLVLVACTSSEPSRPSVSQAALAREESPNVAANADPVGAELELDVRSDGARIVGTLLPTPEGTDADRVIDAVLRTRAGIVPIGHVLDARFVADDVALVDAAHTLVLLHDGARTELDRMAEAPLAVRGPHLVYARGDMPFFELARFDHASCGITSLTEGYGPAYSPAIDVDGSVVFVSSREGRPRVYRVSVDGTIEALATSQRTPSSPRAPRLEGGRLTFDDEHGTTTIDVASGHEVGP